MALADDLNNERFSFSKYTELLCKKSRKKIQNLIPRKDNWRSVRSSFETTMTASVAFTNLNKSILQIESQIIAFKISEDEAIKKELEEERLARLAEERAKALADDLNNERFSFSKYTELLCKKSRKKFQNLIPRKDNWRSVRSSFETTKTASVDFSQFS